MKNKNMKIMLVCILLIIAVLIVVAVVIFNKDKDKDTILDNTKEIEEHYNKFVKVNKETNLYNDNEKVVGKIGKDVELTLNDMSIEADTKYFNIKDLEGYYIKYEDVDKINELSNIDDRYKVYIVFNNNIVTKEKTEFYDENGNLVYSFNEGYSLPIIIKDTDRYGVEFNNRLLYIKSDEGEVINNTNTDKHNASGVGVFNYHSFYDESDPSDSCPSVICHSKKQFKEQLDYLKENNILTLKVKELEMYIDGKIQLPKSVLLTIDDGYRAEKGIEILEEYKMYAALFLVTAVYPPENFVSDYVELHSHSDNLHNVGDCPNGQGGGIQCLDEQTIQEDLKKSREKLNNTTYFCYPFYEYNEYSIKMLKEAGFTMAFAGEWDKSDNLVHVGSDKFRLRRFVIVTYTTIKDIDEYLGQIK